MWQPPYSYYTPYPKGLIPVAIPSSFSDTSLKDLSSTLSALLGGNSGISYRLGDHQQIHNSFLITTLIGRGQVLQCICCHIFTITSPLYSTDLCFAGFSSCLSTFLFLSPSSANSNWPVKVNNSLHYISDFCFCFFSIMTSYSFK